MFNGDTAYITQLKHKHQKGAITFAARRHNVKMLLSSSAFLIYASGEKLTSPFASATRISCNRE